MLGENSLAHDKTASFRNENWRFWSEWGDSFAFSFPKGNENKGVAAVETGGKQLSTGQLYLNYSSLTPTKEKSRHGIKPFLLFWSEWGDSNSRHPAPKVPSKLIHSLFVVSGQVFSNLTSF